MRPLVPRIKCWLVIPRILGARVRLGVLLPQAFLVLLGHGKAPFETDYWAWSWLTAMANVCSSVAKS